MVSLTDLENDFLNPTDMCQKSNLVIKIEYVLQLLLTLFLLFTGNFLEFLLCIPATLYHLKRFVFSSFNFHFFIKSNYIE